MVFIGAALVLAFLLMNIKKKYFEMAAYPLYAAFLLLLIVTPFVAKDHKGSSSWIDIGPLMVQPAEFAKFATTLALSKLISSYGFNLENFKDLIKAVLVVLLPMAAIIMQKETGSALVYLALFLVLYREGMTGSILLFAVVAVVFFILNISLSGHMLTRVPSDVGQFSALIIVPMVSALMLRIYARDRNRSSIVFFSSLGLIVIALLLACYFVPFNVCVVQIGICVLLFLYLLFVYLLEHRSIYLLIAVFVVGSVGYYFSCGYVYNDVFEKHQQERIKVAFGMVEDNSGSGYNVNQSKIAIGSGRLSGKGFLQGTQTKLNYVPEQATDFIFCTIGEERGFLGSVGVLVLYAVFILRLQVLAERQEKNRFARAYGYSLVSIFTLHIFINIGMVIGMVPVIGIPLPFFSYGGSSLLAFTILLFVFLRMDAERAMR